VLAEKVNDLVIENWSHNLFVRQTRTVIFRAVSVGWWNSCLTVHTAFVTALKLLTALIF